MLSSKPDFRTENGSGLDQAQQARARSYSYQLFSQLYLHGLTAVLLPYVQQIPELTAVCPRPYLPDEAAASHHDLFQYNVFAQESFFLSENGLVGGEKTAVVNHIYQQHGYLLNSAATQADHLGHQLAFLALLANLEADAWESQQPVTAETLRKEQAHFMQNHLLTWGISCLLAIQNQADPFFAGVAQLSQTMILAHFETLAETAVPTPPPNFLPPSQNILANDKTGFKEIANYLLLPAFSGIYLSRDDIAQLARQQDLPRGFGSREQMLVNLLRTAVQYDSLPTLLAKLQAACQHWQENYRQMATEQPSAAPFLHPWQSRAQKTGAMLAEILASSPILD